jgi:hypothetical protein
MHPTTQFILVLRKKERTGAGNAPKSKTKNGESEESPKWVQKVHPGAKEELCTNPQATKTKKNEK